MKKLSFGRYDYAAFFTFLAYAAGSVVFPMVIPDLAKSLDFPLESGGMGAAGALHLVRAGAMVISMFFSGFMAARFGLRKMILPGIVLMSGAVALAVPVPSYALLLVVMAAAGVGEGSVEALSTPFVQDLHSDDEPGRYVNFAHSFWSVGVALATIGAGLLLYYQFSWKFVLLIVALCGVPGVIMLLLPSAAEQQKLEMVPRRTMAEVAGSSIEICRCGRFWLYFAAIFFAGGSEWCLTFWIPSFIRLVHGGSAFATGIVMALFALGMVIGRMCAGLLVPQRYLPRLLICCGIFAVICGVIIPFAGNIIFVSFLIVLCGIAVGPFWPSIQSVCVEKLKLDSTQCYIILSCAGVPGCGIFTWLQGAIADIDSIGLRNSFFLMPVSVVIMTLLLLPALGNRTPVANNN